MQNRNLKLKDHSGQCLAPGDFIHVGKIPKYNYEEHLDAAGPEGRIPEFIMGFENSYGYISYYMNELYLYENTGKRGWAREDPRGNWEVCTTIVAIDETKLYGIPSALCREFWVSTNQIKKIPYNILIASIFGGNQWEVMDHTSTPAERPLVVESTERFDYIQKVLQTPYEQLCKAHSAAINSFAK